MGSAVYAEAVVLTDPMRWYLASNVEVLVGSSSECEICLAVPTVSRRHATFTLLGNRVAVKDLGSRNGIRFLGARVLDAQVPVGGSIELGRFKVRFLAPESTQPESAKTELAGMIGNGVQMRRLFAAIEKLAPSQITVMISGETGSGKDKVARALHESSGRSAKPFRVFDCSAVNPALIESELFGHAKGAFSGAISDRMGLLEAAADGTLFIDEVGELPLELQPKLLRAIEAREFRRVGDVVVRACHARIVTATHRDLEAKVAEGSFRLDLYHRLAVAVLHVPALRDRPEDISPLVRLFAREFTGLEVDLSPQTVAAFQCESWPGNVRELRNAVQRTLALGRWRDDLSPNDQPIGLTESREKVIDRFEREFLAKLIEQARGNMSEVARLARISRSQLYRLLEKHGLRADG